MRLQRASPSLVSCDMLQEVGAHETLRYAGELILYFLVINVILVTLAILFYNTGQ